MELKGCAHCGGLNIAPTFQMAGNADARWVGCLTCQECKASGPLCFVSDLEEASPEMVEAWNRRHAA